MSIFEAKNCALTGACHDANGAAANFKMTGAGWENNLVNVMPKGGGTLASECGGANMPYITKANPAGGLLLMKLKASPSCGDRMPTLGDYLTATEIDCIQRWATKLANP
jgi:hypothetical protein